MHEGKSSRESLVFELEFFRQLFVARRVLFLEVLQESVPLPDLFEKSATGRKVFFMGLEMAGQLADFFGENGDLDFWRSGVGIVDFKLADDFILFCAIKCHNRIFTFVL